MSRQLLALCAVLNQSIVHQKIVAQLPASKKVFNFLKLLCALGFISDFEIITKKKKYYRIYLLYNKYGYSVLRNIYIISMPSRRVYLTVSNLSKLHKMTIVLILYTTKGFLTSEQALQNNIGGELVCILS